jgi:hypothetical protein
MGITCSIEYREERATRKRAPKVEQKMTEEP